MTETADSRRTILKPLYPRVAVASLLGSPLLIGGITISGLLSELGEGPPVTAIRTLVLGFCLYLLGRFASVRVIRSGSGRLEIRNPVRTHRIDARQVVGVRTAGFMYRWLALELSDGRQIPVAASFFVHGAPGAGAGRVHDLVLGLGRVPAGAAPRDPA